MPPTLYQDRGHHAMPYSFSSHGNLGQQSFGLSGINHLPSSYQPQMSRSFSWSQQAPPPPVAPPPPPPPPPSNGPAPGPANGQPVLGVGGLGQSELKQQGFDLSKAETFGPIEKAVKLTYDQKKRDWTAAHMRVQLGVVPFDRGVTRYVHQMRVHCPDGTVEKRVAKFLDPEVLRPLVGPVTRDMYFDDAMVHVTSRNYAAAFNARNPPKNVNFVESYVLELSERPGKPLCNVEPLMEGFFTKHNNNNGGVLSQRETPQAFSHFTYEASNFELLVCDIQGVNDIFTDPQIHTRDGTGFGLGNQGQEGMFKFLQSHTCNGVCTMMGLAVFQNGVIVKPGTGIKPISETCSEASEEDDKVPLHQKTLLESLSRSSSSNNPESLPSNLRSTKQELQNLLGGERRASLLESRSKGEREREWEREQLDRDIRERQLRDRVRAISDPPTRAFNINGDPFDRAALKSSSFGLPGSTSYPDSTSTRELPSLPDRHDRPEISSLARAAELGIAPRLPARRQEVPSPPPHESAATPPGGGPAAYTGSSSAASTKRLMRVSTSALSTASTTADGRPPLNVAAGSGSGRGDRDRDGDEATPSGSAGSSGRGGADSIDWDRGRMVRVPTPPLGVAPAPAGVGRHTPPLAAGRVTPPVGLGLGKLGLGGFASGSVPVSSGSTSSPRDSKVPVVYMEC
eukprot:CAMPEP_0114555622 /NCGR_PEP_ID=MMETSP0114-20121206/8850_1 /TAXON_ID=31324 /ORGANISM="Goniomonas sp, Strain m" /LENGTH=682 /DNA_ID=CAMNT_0001740765 /DNA_START=54 /DNA_END=2102 /DNA_ORIENTATION=-